MDERRQPVLDLLNQLAIPYELVEHPAVFTMEEAFEAFAQAFPEGKEVHICKNLFLRDAKGKRHFLVVMDGEKQINLANLQQLLGGIKLTFASPGRLMQYLGLEKGAVTPFGLINDREQQVEVVVDQSLVRYPLLGLHPNENSATVLITWEGLQAFLTHQGNPLQTIDLDTN